MFDPDQTGHVSVIEIQEALHVWYGDRISEEEVQEISAFADLDNNGFVKEQGITVLAFRSFESVNSIFRTTSASSSPKEAKTSGDNFPLERHRTLSIRPKFPISLPGISCGEWNSIVYNFRKREQPRKQYARF